MIKTPNYKDILNDYPKELIHTWPFILISPECRLHYKVIDPEDNEKYGFYFHSVYWTGGNCSNNNDYLDDSDSTGETLFHGIAYFDGIRHLYFGTKESQNEGYFYYPNLDIYIKIMKELANLERKHCSYIYKRDL